MSVAVFVELTVKPELVDEMKAALKQILPETRKFKGCRAIDVWGNQDQSNNIILSEIWETKEDHQKYVAWRTETGAMAELGARLAEPPSIRYYDKVDA